MKIVVTGAAGFIGSHLCERLSGAGHEVIGIDCFTDYYDVELKRSNAAAVKAAGAEVVDIDLAVDDLGEVLDGVELVYHLAAQPGISDTVSFADYVRNNISATHRLVECLRGNLKLKLLVNISTSSVYGYYATSPEDAQPEPVSFYGVTKLAAEQLCMSGCRQEQLPACSLRLFSVYGPRERPEKLYPKLIKSVLGGTEFGLYKGSAVHSRSFTYVADAVDAMVQAGKRIDDCAGQIINIGSDVEITTAQAIATVERVIGKKAKIIDLPGRGGDQLRTCADITKARKILNYRPKTSFEDGIKEQVQWFRQRLGI